MARSLSARDFIQLPTYDAHTAEVFARRLLAQYRQHRGALHYTKVAARAHDLQDRVDALSAALGADQARTRDAHEAAALDPMVDATWAALLAYLEAWAKLTWLPQGKTAQAVLDAVFPTRLDFTQRKYPQQWSEANARIHQIHARDADHPREPTLAQKIHSLGGEVFLDEIAEKHARFGKALGLTDGKRAPTAVDVRTPWEELMGSAKDFVAAVLQLDDHDVEHSDSVKHDLLAVIDEFPSPARTPAAPGSSPADGGTQTGAGGS